MVQKVDQSAGQVVAKTEDQPDQQEKTEPTRPVEVIAVDELNVEGRHYLVVTDKFSGWPELYKLTRVKSGKDGAWAKQS